MNKFRQIINKIVLQLYAGLKVTLNQYGDYSITVDGQTVNVDENTYLIYDANNKCFNITENGKITIKDVDVEPAMQMTIDYLYETDMQRKSKELQTGQKQATQHSYTGWKIPPQAER